MPTRSYFLKGLRAKAVVRPPKPVRPKAPDHKRKVVMAVRLRPTGTTEHQAMSSRKAAQVLGGQKGGLVSAALGTAYRWDSAAARKAAIKSWTKRRKFNKRIMARVGMRANRREKLWREPLRAYYAENMTRGIRYCPVSKRWLRVSWTWDIGSEIVHGDRQISERAALTALGHLRSVRGFIPDSTTPSPRRSDKS